jgi:hypothetical protein
MVKCFQWRFVTVGNDTQWLTTVLSLYYDRTSSFEKINFITEDTKVKHANITTI